MRDLDDAVREKRTVTLKQNGQLIRLSIKITTMIFRLSSGTVRKQRLDLWNDRLWILQQYNVPSHPAVPLKVFLVNHSIPVLYPPPYSSDIDPCDFNLFQNIKSELNKKGFESVESVNTKLGEILKKLTKGGHPAVLC